MQVTSSSAAPPLERLYSIVLDSSRDAPLHAQLRTALQRMITEEFTDDSRFYSETQLVDALSVSQGTVRRALTDLAQTGLIERRRAQATFVRLNPDKQFPKKLAVFVVDYRSAKIANMLSSLHAVCVERDIEMLPLYTYQGQHLNKAYKQINFTPREGAVIILENPQSATQELERALAERNFSFVTVDTRLPSHRGHFVGTDGDSGIRIAVEHLAGLGHQRITLLVTEPDTANTRSRVSAFERYCKQYNVGTSRIHDCHMVPWDHAYDAGRRGVEAIWAQSPQERPTALLAVSDMGALGAMKWLLENGVRVPEDISVMGFDGIDTGAVCHPALTSIRQPYDLIAKETLGLANRPMAQPQVLLLEPSLIQRESTGKPSVS